MKEKIIEILNRYKQDMEGYSYYSSNYGVSDGDFEEIADEIVKLIREEEVKELKSQVGIEE